ncbi:MAG TPA: sulfotransferase [Rudaea sp.]|nr:sulfotransferase [Rudaea sp.]
MSIATSSSADAQLATARSLWEQGDLVRGEAVLRDLAARYPAREDALTLLAKLLQSQGRLDAASEVIFDLCRVAGFPTELSVRGAQFIQQCDRQPLAAELCDAAIARDRATPALLVAAGNIARELGDFAKARAHYLAALDANVDLDSSFVLGALAHTMRYPDASHPDFAIFQAHFRNPLGSLRARAATGFGLAKAHDDIGDYASAAGILREANGMVREVLPWSAPAWDNFVDARMHERIASVRGAGSADFIPIFVVGLPRTGTTLTATRLAAHTGARDRGELRTLRYIAGQLVAGAHLGDTAAIAEAAELYRTLSRQDDAPAPAYIDQDPLNFRYLHLVQALFPRARVVHCRRSPRDTALSLWSQDFAHPDCAFAYDFASIAHYAAGHDRLMRHWQRTVSLPQYTLDYETFVADPQGTLAALRAFIGTPEPDIAAPSGAMPINSASVWQARQPVYAHSVGRWRQYAEFVPELTALFGDEATA